VTSGVPTIPAESSTAHESAPLPGFEHINRYWDPSRNMFTAKIRSGEYYVTRGGELIATTLGSCVAACIRDRVAGIGGINHFLLPTSTVHDRGRWEGTPVSAAARYGNLAMELLINHILAHGGKRQNLEIKVFGGARLLNMKIDIGKRNTAFVKHYLNVEGLPIAAEDLGGLYSRKLLYDSASGRTLVKKLHNLRNKIVIESEKQYLHELERKPVSGETDLF
jgi:chemotaxis protein CheD